MSRQKFLGLSTGTTILVAALFSIGSVFVGANGLIPLSVFTAFASVCAGTFGVADLARTENSSKYLVVIGTLALTLSLLIPVFTWTANAAVPLAAVSVLALIPVACWAVTWLIAQRRMGPSPAGA